MFATDDVGVKIWEATYLPFGGVHTSTGATIDLRFPGQWFQSESGLHQNWMREYDSTTGRYIQGDPLGLVDGASVYGYVSQNPLHYVDPLGLKGKRANRPKASNPFLQGVASYPIGLYRCYQCCDTPGLDTLMQRIQKALFENPELLKCILDYLKENPGYSAGRLGTSVLVTAGLGAATSAIGLGATGTAAGLTAGFAAGRDDIGYQLNRAGIGGLTPGEAALVGIFGTELAKEHCKCGAD